MNHTPGKWEIIKERAPNGSTYYRIVEPNAQAHNVIAQVIGDGRVEYHANAHLIAAAPELYALAARLEDALLRLPHLPETISLLDMEQLRAALTKANGH